MANQQAEQVEAKLFDSDVIDFSQYFQVIKRFFWRILSLAFFLTVLVGLVVLTMTPHYTAKVSILIEAEKTNVLAIEEVYGLDSSRKEYFETQYEILRSRQIAERVVERMQLQNNPHFDKDILAESEGMLSGLIDGVKESLKAALPFLPQQVNEVQTEEERLASKKSFAVSLLMERTRVNPLKNTQVVEVSVETPNNKLSANIANEMADVYIENYLEAKLEMTQKATRWLNESLEGLRTKLDESEKRLADFDETEQLVDVDGVVGLASEELSQLSDQLIDAQVALKRSQAIYEQVNQQGLSIAELSTIPEVLNHPSIQSVKREEILAQSRVSELREVFGPKHPRMIAATAELASIQESIRQQISNLVSGITNEYRSAEAKVKALQLQVSQSRSDFRNLSNLESRRKTLQRDVDTNQQLYDSFFTRLKETDQLGGFESAHARVLDAAKPPVAPSRPRKGLIIAAAFVLSIGLGVFLALSLEALNSGIRSVDDVERKLSQRMLGIIPWQPHNRKEDLPLKHYFDQKHHVFSESVRTLRTSMQLLNIEKPSQVILVTSSVPKEGKSTVAINLSFALGQLSKVLLLDTDLRKPSVAKQFGLPGFQPGVANIISGSHTLDECVVHDEASNIHVLCAGTLPPNPQELLASSKFADLMAKLRETYQYIIVDSAPIQAVSDAIVVSKHCDSLMYVVRADSTSYHMINNGLSRFIEVGHRIDGIVLNQVDLKKAKKTGEYSGFYDQYGYNSYKAEDANS
ncbi:GumC family protein [Glaciecola siphonariae]|uniref:non-specific protein-tyrosine kinase n=1 Tax=Glaciecola siphonariae TaxID=521012 RepID=A0ABV9M2W2_9ALTE